MAIEFTYARRPHAKSFGVLERFGFEGGVTADLSDRDSVTYAPRGLVITALYKVYESKEAFAASAPQIDKVFRKFETADLSLLKLEPDEARAAIEMHMLEWVKHEHDADAATINLSD